MPRPQAPPPSEQNLTPHSSSGHFNRREFLESSARNAAGLAAGALSLGTVRAPHERLQIGVIGLGVQGLELARSVAQSGQADVVAICDVDARILAVSQQELGRLQKSQPVIIPRHEALFERREIDAVFIATPDHWHGRMAAEGLQAGKDLFIETPVSHSIREGEWIARMVEQSDRIVQVGLSHRSGTHFQSAVKLIRSGFLGQVHLAKAWAVHRRKSIGHCATARPPLGVDYPRWLGPAPSRNYQANRFHQQWPWFWDYGSGELGLWGVQHLDVVRWALDLGVPGRVFATGGIHSFHDDRETPDTLTVHYDYPNVEVLWEHRQWSNRGIEGRSSGAAFYGDLGTLIVDRSGWKVYDHHEDRYCNASEIKQSQVSNFLQAVRDRTQPIASFSDGQNSSILCHLGNISYRLGREIQFDPLLKTFPGDLTAQDHLLASIRDPWQFTEEQCRLTS